MLDRPAASNLAVMNRKPLFQRIKQSVTFESHVDLILCSEEMMEAITDRWTQLVLVTVIVLIFRSAETNQT